MKLDRNVIIGMCRLFLALLGSIGIQAAGLDLSLPASQPWTDTGLNLARGQRIGLRASGQVTIEAGPFAIFSNTKKKRGPWDRTVGPRGSYRFAPYERFQRHPLYRARGASGSTSSTTFFPLPAAYWGPWPAYGLIGRIGPTGRPFYVGKQLDLTAPAAGRLYLGINDFDCGDNRGEWSVRILPEGSMAVSPAPLDGRVHLAGTPAAPSEPAPPANDKLRVIVLYVDGLRPDVLAEMAGGGFLPNINEIFFRQGTQVDPALSIYPSSTIPANAVMWTGLFSDRNGIKDQVVLERRAGGPPREIDRLTEFAPEQTGRLIRRQGGRPLNEYFPDACFSTILPIHWFSPPRRWISEAANVPTSVFSSAAKVKRNLDRANFQHALTFLHKPQARVMILWFPDVDETGHRTPYGQFGAARRTLTDLDEMVGRLREELRFDRIWDDTILILCADHGHLGGELLPDGGARLNQVWDIAADFFLPQGYNVRHLHRQWTLPGVDKRRYVYLGDGGGGTGYLGLYLPFASGDSKDWSRRNRLRELMAYQLSTDQPPVDLLATLVGQRVDATHYRTDIAGNRPVAMILAAIDETNFLIYESPARQALVTLRRGANAREDRVRYLPIRNYRFSTIRNAYEYEQDTLGDPLGYLADPEFARALPSNKRAGFCAEFHSLEEWLAATARTRYPGAPVLMAHHLLSAPNLTAEVRAAAPDLVLVPNPGWYFVEHAMDYQSLAAGSAHFQGTTHGYPDRGSMRVPLFFSGRGVRRGVVLDRPATLADLTPTILWLFGKPVESFNLDGRPLYEILERRP